MIRGQQAGGYRDPMGTRRFRRTRPTAMSANRLRRIAWRKLGRDLSRVPDLLWAWLRRIVLRSLLAFLAGAGALALLIFGAIWAIGIERATVSIGNVLLVLTIGGVAGVVIQRNYRKLTFFGRIPDRPVAAAGIDEAASVSE